MARVALLLTLIAASALPLASQTLRFEVASVKPNRSADASGGMRVTADRVTATANLLIEVIRNAYQIDYVRIIGAPDWTNRERFDISATLPPSSTRQQIGAMLQSLLADRFALKAHRETRPIRVYVLSKADGGGPARGLRPSTVDCANAQPPCGERNQPRGVYRAIGAQWPTGILIGELRVAVGAPVIDRTGIAGRYDIDLEWADPTATVDGQAAASERPSLFTALREQLGLKLEASTEPTEVLVIDSAERPTPD